MVICRVLCTQLDNEQKLKADVVVLEMGVIPNIKLAQNAGLKVDKIKGIHVDEFMRTSDSHIFATGACTWEGSLFTRTPSFLRLASIRTLEAHIASANLFGLHHSVV